MELNLDLFSNFCEAARKSLFWVLTYLPGFEDVQWQAC